MIGIARSVIRDADLFHLNGDGSGKWRRQTQPGRGRPMVFVSGAFFFSLTFGFILTGRGGFRQSRAKRALQKEAIFSVCCSRAACRQTRGNWFQIILDTMSRNVWAFSFSTLLHCHLTFSTIDLLYYRFDFEEGAVRQSKANQIPFQGRTCKARRQNTAIKWRWIAIRKGINAKITANIKTVCFELPRV